MGPKTTTDWDAKTYERLSAPQERWARAVLERLPLEGDETVLDAGCGSGRVTRLLLERLPRGGVIGVDGSPSMIEAARDAFREDERVRLITTDLLELSPDLLRREAGVEAVDAVFSNATFHWIADHQQLFQRLHSVLRPGGELVAQCGGRGNVAEWMRAIETASDKEPFAEHLRGFQAVSFYGPEETEARLHAAGFAEAHCWLEQLDAIQPENPREWVSVVGLAAYKERLPEELHEPFTDAVIEALPDPVEFRYIRLNLDARRPA